MSDTFTDFSIEEIKTMANEIHKKEPKYGMAYAYRVAMLYLSKKERKESIYITDSDSEDDE